MSFVDFHEKILEILAPLKNSGEIKKIYGYEPEELSGFPCISVTASSNSEGFYSTCSNFNVYVFNILIFDDLSSKTELIKNFEIRMMTLADSILDLLRKSDFSGVNGVAVLPKIGGFKYLRRESGNVRAFEIQIEIKKKLPR